MCEAKFLILHFIVCVVGSVFQALFNRKTEFRVNTKFKTKKTGQNKFMENKSIEIQYSYFILYVYRKHFTQTSTQPTKMLENYYYFAYFEDK